MKVKLATLKGTVEAEIPADAETINVVLDPADDESVIDVAIQVEREGIDERFQLLGTWINIPRPTFGELVSATNTK